MRRCQHTVCQCRRDCHARVRRPDHDVRECPGRAPGRSRGSGTPWPPPRRAPGAPPSRRPASPRPARGRAARLAWRAWAFLVLRAVTGHQGYPRPPHRATNRTTVPSVRLVIARCSVDYDGRLTAHLPAALRLLIVKADGSVLVHSDGGSYKPLNWMSPPCRLTEHRTAAGQVDGHQQGRRDADDHHRGDAVRHLGRPRRRPGPGQGRRRVAPAGAAGRAAAPARRRLAADPPRVPHPDRPGRHHVPRRRRRARGRRAQAARRDRRDRAADQVPGAAEPGPAAVARCRACSPRRRSSSRRARWPRTAASAAWCSTTTPCAASSARARCSSPGASPEIAAGDAQRLLVAGQATG